MRLDVKELDKQAMGKRIRQIRLTAGMRQWELAKLLGTTQSAVHKYEHGVVPEPRRLIELARIGGTSIEWVLTGMHWENGSELQERPTPELLQIACMFRELTADGRETVDEALRIIQKAVEALRESDESEQPSVMAAALRDHATETTRLLESAWRVQRAVLRQVARDAGKRLAKAPSLSGNGKRDK
jgi:transcriptional regulator with XRE-family HTH domain